MERQFICKRLLISKKIDRKEIFYAFFKNKNIKV